MPVAPRHAPDLSLEQTSIQLSKSLHPRCRGLGRINLCCRKRNGGSPFGRAPIQIWSGFFGLDNLYLNPPGVSTWSSLRPQSRLERSDKVPSVKPVPLEVIDVATNAFIVRDLLVLSTYYTPTPAVPARGLLTFLTFFSEECSVGFKNPLARLGARRHNMAAFQHGVLVFRARHEEANGT